MLSTILKDSVLIAHLIYFKKMNDIDFLIQSLVDIINKKKKHFQSKDVECVSNLYVIQLISQMLEEKR